MSILTIMFLVCMGITVLSVSVTYRSDKRHHRSWDYGDAGFALAISTICTAVVMVLGGIILAVIAENQEGEIVDTYKAELIPMVDEDQELLTVDDNVYVFSYLRENGSPVKEEVWYPDVTIMDYDGEPYMVKEQWMGPDNYFPWQWQRWDDTRYVIYTDAETAPLVAQ